MGCFHQIAKEANLMTGPIVGMEIDKAIELVTDKKCKEILIQHKIEHEYSEISVTEKEDIFETIVTHPSTEYKTGGAEQYFIDKKTGKSTMGWHEHPMVLPESVKSDFDEKSDINEE